ncbi:MAG TPA: peptidoglycan DD-metalloendopeptidase family protein [Myxococcota bacterium]|nr:peptidoglycan DD-metalloendopeptidase family protein [Myxococcota bacterium]
MRRGARWLALGLCAAAVWPASADERGERLEKLRAEIEERERNAHALVEQADGALAEIEAADRELQEIRQSLASLRGAERAAQAELETAQGAAREAEAELGRVERALDQRLVALYKFEASGGIAKLASAGSAELGARRRSGLAHVLEQDRALFARLRAARSAADETRVRAQALVAELAGTRREAALREDRLRRRTIERRNLAALLRSRAERESRTVAELRAAAQRLEGAIERMPREARPFSGAGLQRGQVRRPVGGRVRMAFGRQVDPEFGTQTLRNGVEIEAPAGTPVEAVADGRVLFAGWFRGYGQMVIVDHGGNDLTVLGYLDALSVKKGDMVRAGQEIGTVGDTGSLSGAGLYFEIRASGKPVDPQAWLEE